MFSGQLNNTTTTVLSHLSRAKYSQSLMKSRASDLK